MKKTLLLISIATLLTSCNSETPESNEIASTEESVTDSNLDKLKTEASRLRGGSLIKEVILNNDEATIIYASDYDEYKVLNPDSNLDENTFLNYWETGDAIVKNLNDGSVRVMKNLDYINKVNIIMPYNGTKYEISVNKKDLEEYIGKDFNSITNDWEKSFVDVYIYDKGKRKDFFNKFGKKTEV